MQHPALRRHHRQLSASLLHLARGEGHQANAGAVDIIHAAHIQDHPPYTIAGVLLHPRFDLLALAAKRQLTFELHHCDIRLNRSFRNFQQHRLV